MMASETKFGLKGYNSTLFTDDLVAAIIVTVLLVPQALAYAFLAGLPPQTGIYASIFPLIAYAIFGSSRHLAVGPTAVVSLLTAVSIAALPAELRIEGAVLLALFTGIVLTILGLLRAGSIMNFVARPVVSAYVTGAAILIIISQLRHVFGVTSEGDTAIALTRSLLTHLSERQTVPMIIGMGTIVFLLLMKRYLAFTLYRLGLSRRMARLTARLTPIVAVFVTIIISAQFSLSTRYGLNVVGDIPAGLPSFGIPALMLEQDRSFYEGLIITAFIIAIVAFVDSMSIAQTLAARSRNRIDANRELLGLGASNIVAGLSYGYPINGSLSRSAVNFSAGAQTAMAGMITAVFMAVVALFLTPYLSQLPLATLAALIITACFNIFEFKALWRTWRYSRTDGLTAVLTLFTVLLFGVVWGVVMGVVLAMGLHIRTTLRPHMAIVGRFPGTEHYRDAERFNVETSEVVKTLRIDESLYYANARYLEDKVARLVADSPEMKHLILMCPAVNRIDASALSSLLTINERLQSAGMKLHFSELHSHVKERLHRSNIVDKLSGAIFLSQHEAMETLQPEPDWAQLSDHIDIH